MIAVNDTVIGVDTPTRWHQADALLADALERPADQRDAFVEAACEGDGDLCRLVQALLVADRHPAALLATGNGASATASPAEKAVGRDAEMAPAVASMPRIGAYQLLLEIGRGGSAVVYLAARDDDVARRLVALKLIRQQKSNDMLVTRFRLERQILAALEHPNIARMYDGGATEDGDLFLVMELVDGMPIDAHCAALALPIAARLKLFIDVCSAVQYAHRNLLVHRDIKPGNILVTAAGVPKLLDFGIAKPLVRDPLADEVPSTLPHMRPMTPRYASPEQVSGEAITTQSDVYSLGVLLYELLTGRSPYVVSGGAPKNLELAICSQTPEPPSRAVLQQSVDACRAIGGLNAARLAQRLRGDLDTVVMKALRKRPGNRYMSVEQLVDDIRRHLELRPLVARPPTPLERASRFVRRHRWASVAVAISLFVLTVFTVVLSRQVRARHAALLNAEQAYRSSDRTLAFLTGLFQDAGVDSGLGKDVSARAVVDLGAARVARDLADEPLLRATIENTIGEVYLGLGDHQRALGLLRQVYDQRRLAFGAHHLATATARHSWAQAELAVGNYRAAELFLLEVLTVRRDLLEEGHLDTLRATFDLASVLRLTGRQQEAVVLYRQSIAGPKSLGYEADILATDAHTGLGLALLAIGELDEAEVELRNALRGNAERHGDSHLRTTDARSNLGLVLNFQGRFSEAEIQLRQALADAAAHVDDVHPSVVVTTNQLAIACMRLGNTDEAEELFRSVVQKRRLRLGDDHHRLANALDNLAALLINKGDALDEASDLLAEAIEIQRRAFGEKSTSYALVLHGQANLRRVSGDPEAALAVYQRTLTILEANHGRDHALIAYPLIGMAFVHAEGGDHEVALPPFRDALEIRRRTLGDDHWETASIAGKLGECFTALGRYVEAEPHLLASYAVLMSTFDDDHERNVDARSRLVDLYNAWSRPVDAARFREAKTRHWKASSRRRASVEPRFKASSAWLVTRVTR